MYRLLLRLLLFIVIALLLWNVALHWTPVYPYLSLYGHRATDWVSTQWQHGLQWFSSDEKRELIEQTNALKQRLAQLEAEKRALTLSCKSDVDRVSTSHRVIGYHPLDTWQVMFLDGGRNQGVQVGQVAIDTHGFLAGRISRVYRDYSELLLITNPQETVDARIGTSGYRAIVSGRFERLTAKRGMWLSQGEFIDHLSPIVSGDTVTTSGLDGHYPPNLPIGKIHKIWKDKLNLFQEALIIPGIEFSQLKTVYLLTTHLPELPL